MSELDAFALHVACRDPEWAATEITWLRAALREVYEVWAGSDGFIPETAAEGYQQRLILQMRDAAAKGLGVQVPATDAPPNQGIPQSGGSAEPQSEPQSVK